MSGWVKIGDELDLAAWQRQIIERLMTMPRGARVIVHQGRSYGIGATMQRLVDEFEAISAAKRRRIQRMHRDYRRKARR